MSGNRSSCCEEPLPFPAPARKGYKWANVLRGLVHRWILLEFSILYCDWFDIPREGGIFPLPFNTILKGTDGTREEEAIAMQAARSIGLPVPRFISYGDHGAGQNGSILMTRIPGQLLNDVLYTLSQSERETIASELDVLLHRMRMYANPYGTGICTVDGNALRSPRLPGCSGGPCPDPHAFYDEMLLIGAHPIHWPGREQQYERHMENYHHIYDMAHSVVFTHGDLRDHNIMVNNGHISGIIDWECAGWYPEYWEFTSMLRGPRYPPENLWLQFVQSISSNTYQTEYEYEWSLWCLTQDSWGH